MRLKKCLLLIIVFSSLSSAKEPVSYDVKEEGKHLIITNLKTSKSVVFKNYKRYDNFTIKLPFEFEEELSAAQKKLVARHIADAKVFFASGQYSKAWNSLTKAEGIDGKNPEVKTMKGSLQLQFGNKKEAIKYYKDSLLIKPDQPEVRKQLKNLKSNG